MPLSHIWFSSGMSDKRQKTYEDVRIETQKLSYTDPTDPTQVARERELLTYFGLICFIGTVR